MTYQTRTKNENGILHIYSKNPDKNISEKLVYQIDKTNKTIKLFPIASFPLELITLDGFIKIPEEFSESGYLKSGGGVKYQLEKIINEHKIDEFVISKNSENKLIKKSNKKKKLVLNYKTFLEIKKICTTVNYDAQRDKSAGVIKIFHDLFGKDFELPKIATGTKIRHFLQAIDPSVIDSIKGDNITKTFDFFKSFIEKKHKMADFIKAAKLKVDEVTLDKIINDFSNLILKNATEEELGKFLISNLYVVDTRYTNAIPELNVILANSRRVDFGLIDFNGYLDIYEIKRPNTKILSEKEDHGNFYWHSDSIAAIVQAEKYLYNAKAKGPALEQDIDREFQYKVKIREPRAFVILGTSAQLDSDKKKEDFKILRTSFKNVEIVLYDELLKRLENQKHRYNV